VQNLPIYGARPAPAPRTRSAHGVIHMPSPFLICLPDGLNVSGVTMWAVRLANGLAERGHVAALALHAVPHVQKRLDIPLHRGVRLFDLAHLPRFDDGADVAPVIGEYRAIVDALSEPSGGRAPGPVVISPNLHGDCFGVAAALARDLPVRILGWGHADNQYDVRVLSHYERAISAFVGVSDTIAGRLRGALPARAGDIHSIPHGIDAPSAFPRSIPAPLHSGIPAPLRLIYTGRLEHRQKRILALPALSRELTRLGIDHALTIVGDGPARAELAAAIGGDARVRLIPPVGPDEVQHLLDAHDLFILPSRYEGLSVAMLEAMARGCVPVVTRTDSGASQVIGHGVNGLIADADPDADEPDAAAAIAQAIARITRAAAGALPAGANDLRDLTSLARAAWTTVRSRFSLDTHVAAVASLVERVAASPPRPWPADRSASFSASAPGTPSGSVPPEGPELLRSLLRSLAGRRIVVHGTGAHTRQLADIFLTAPADLVAFADDDRANHGTRVLDRPVIAPNQAAATGATDVVISSWMHEEAIWKRRGVYERQGLSVRRIYAPMCCGPHPTAHSSTSTASGAGAARR